MNNEISKLFEAGYTIGTDQLITLGMTEPQFLDWLTAIKKDQVQYNEMRADMKMLKDHITKALIELKVLNRDGTKNEKFRISSIVGVVASMASPFGSSVQEKFAFLGELRPLVEKYRDL